MFTKNKYIVLLVMVLCSISLKAQTPVSGSVTDTKGKVVAGASVSIKDSYDGATADSAGKFHFTTTENGFRDLEISCLGYGTILRKINITGKPIVLHLNLRELVTELKAVVISAGTFEASDKKRGAVLDALDIVTIPSANGDVSGAFKTLPGTQQVGESEGLFVRGGTATESKIYIDGNLVNNFFYSSLPDIASHGRFNPFLFKGTIFSSGGYSALYGQALSSALILESKDLPDKTSADLNVSVIGLGGGIQKLAKNKKYSWGVSFNCTDLQLAFKVNKQVPDFYKTPVAQEGDLNFRAKTKTGGFIKYYGYFSGNITGLRSTDIDSADIKSAFHIQNVNTFQNINWKENLGKGWKLNAGFSFSTNKDDIKNETQDKDNNKILITNPDLFAYKNFSLLTRSIYAQPRIVIEKKLKGLSALRFGSDYFISNEKATYTLYNGVRFIETVKEKLLALFAETDLYASNNLALKLGSRAEHSENIYRWNIAPRASVSYKLTGGGQASFAYGIFYQNPERKYLPGATDLKYQRADHYILQYLFHNTHYTFRTEIFYKKYLQLVKTDYNIYGKEIAKNNAGYGDARGFELFWRDRKIFRNVDYWISYSYLDTKRDFLNYPGLIEPDFAARHTASLVIKRFVMPLKTEFNASYTFATGRPYYNIRYDNATSGFVIADQGRTQDYNTLGISINYLPNLGKKNSHSFIVWVLNISNALGQKQVFTYNYSYNGSRKVAVTPPTKRFIFIGCFISFGIDRSEDAINNHL